MQLVRRAMDANRSGPPEETVERAVALVHDDFQFVSRLSSVEGATYGGPDGCRAYFTDMADAWRAWRFEVTAISEIAPGTVFVDNTFHATGRSGVEVEVDTASVFSVSGGRVRRIDSYSSRQEALEAAGLS